jgi:hypothetical protein
MVSSVLFFKSRKWFIALAKATIVPHICNLALGASSG